MGVVRLGLNIFFKAQDSPVEIPMDHLSLTQRNTRRIGSYAIPTSNVDAHLHSFYPDTVRLWNDLPAECKQARNADSFKILIDNITLKSAY